MNERITEVANLLGNPQMERLIGFQWYYLGRSKRDALSKPVALEALSKINTWRYKQLIPGEYFYGLNLWNGQTHPKGCNVSITLNSSPVRLDTIVISRMDINYLSSVGLAWETVLLATQLLADELGGLALLSSHELLDQARESQFERPEYAAYAAFWGITKRERQSTYHMQTEDGKRSPFSVVVCNSWEDVQSPDLSRVKGLIRLLRSDDV